MPQNSPIHAEPKTAEAEAATKAAISILPSRPISTMPARSDQRPAMQARISGTLMRIVEARSSI